MHHRDTSVVEWRDVDASCIECHAPLIHIAQGEFYCPYARAGMHIRAHAMLAWMVLNSAPAPMSYLASGPIELSVNDFAQWLKTGHKRIWKMIRTGELRSRKIGKHRLIDISDILTTMEKR